MGQAFGVVRLRSKFSFNPAFENCNSTLQLFLCLHSIINERFLINGNHGININHMSRHEHGSTLVLKRIIFLHPKLSQRQIPRPSIRF